MSEHIRSKPDQKTLSQEKKSNKEREQQLNEANKDQEFIADAFTQQHIARSTYDQLCIDYNAGILKKFARIAHSEAGMEPFWDYKKNQPQKLPLNQYNTSSKRYKHSITQLGMPYNSFFPNQSYAKSLVDIDIFPRDFETSDGLQSPSEKTTEAMRQEQVVEQGFDQLMKSGLWAKLQHTRMVSDMINYGVGIYHFPDKEGYKYHAVDFTKMKFPVGSTIDPNGWEYFFMEHDMSTTALMKIAQDTPSGWNQARVVELLRAMVDDAGGHSGDQKTLPSEKDKIDKVIEGNSPCNISTIISVRVPLVSLFWKNSEGKVSKAIFPANNVIGDGFLYENENEFEKFEDRFSVFPMEEKRDEIRMVKGWGHTIHNLCHAYERTFCKMLDHLDQSSTTFIQMDPSEAHKKILHLGSINVGKFEKVDTLSSNLAAIVSAMVFLDQKIDQITFTKGLNKSEMKGEGRGAELATVLLTMEGRVHKHFLSRFIDRYSAHWTKVMGRVLNISLNDGLRKEYKDVATKFYDFVTIRGVSEEVLQKDNSSGISDIPRNWMLAAKKPDGTGVSPASFDIIQSIQPYLSSLSEPGLKIVLERVIQEAFNDVDAVAAIFPSSDIARVSAEADIQNAMVQASVLTDARSDFDMDFDLVEGIDPRLSDLHKFETFPASRRNDHSVYLNVFLNKADEATARFNRREIGRPTYHIWLFNLVSSAKEHVSLLSSDAIRSKRSESRQLFDRFGKAFNLLRQVESQANAERSKALDKLEKKLAEQEANSPERIKAVAELERSRTEQAKVVGQFRADEFEALITLGRERRAEEAHVAEMRLKNKELFEPPKTINQSNVGRPAANEQR